jgi:hypothetical protein
LTTTDRCAVSNFDHREREAFANTNAYNERLNRQMAPPYGCELDILLHNNLQKITKYNMRQRLNHFFSETKHQINLTCDRNNEKHKYHQTSSKKHVLNFDPCKRANNDITRDNIIISPLNDFENTESAHDDNDVDHAMLDASLLLNCVSNLTTSVNIRNINGENDKPNRDIIRKFLNKLKRLTINNTRQLSGFENNIIQNDSTWKLLGYLVTKRKKKINRMTVCDMVNVGSLIDIISPYAEEEEKGDKIAQKKNASYSAFCDW